MAETIAEKLKRLAREKAAAKEAPVAIAQPVVAEVVEVTEASKDGNSESALLVHGNGSGGSTVVMESQQQPDVQLRPECDSNEVGRTDSLDSVSSNEPDNSDTDNSLPCKPSASSNHPLTMQFMELEQALDSTDPAFKVKLRDIHRHLGKDPELVTLMTEEEVALVVKGMLTLANAEVIEPAKAKATKAVTSANKKKVISADDL